MLLDGVARIARGTKSLTEEQWEEQICGRWTARELAHHLLAQSRTHHHWLDKAISGDASVPYGETEVDRENDAAIELLSDMSGPETIQEFLRTAGRYANRVADHWDEKIGFVGGSATAGQHCALIALEYHLHAWDIVQRDDANYRPPRVRQLGAAVGAANAAQRRGLAKMGIRANSWLHQHLGAWDHLLAQSGRSAHTVEDQTVIKPEQVIDLRSDGKLTLPTTDRASVPSD